MKLVCKFVMYKFTAIKVKIFAAIKKSRKVNFLKAVKTSQQMHVSCQDV